MDIDDRAWHENAKYHYSYTIDWSPSSSLAFSPDNRDYAFIVRRSLLPGSADTDKYYLVKNGVIGKEVPVNSTPQYSLQKKDFVAVSNRLSDDCGKEGMYPIFSHDLKSHACIATDGNKQYVLKD